MRLNAPFLIGTLLAVAALWPAPSAAQPKSETSPLLVAVDNAHCLALYDAVELRLKGRGDDAASITTRNGFKDFFVTRPGVVDCSGQREIPWRDDKDRAFIDAVLTATNEALKAKADMAKDYGIGPAPRPTIPRL
jgi:hypothetical protein